MKEEYDHLCTYFPYVNYVILTYIKLFTKELSIFRVCDYRLGHPVQAT